MPAGFRSHHQPLPRNEPVPMSYCSSTGVEYSPLCTLSPAGSSSQRGSLLAQPAGRSGHPPPAGGEGYSPHQLGHDRYRSRRRLAWVQWVSRFNHRFSSDSLTCLFAIDEMRSDGLTVVLCREDRVQVFLSFVWPRESPGGARSGRISLMRR